MSLSVPSLKVLEMLPSVPLDLAMRVLQSVVKEGAFYLLDPPAILRRRKSIKSLQSWSKTAGDLCCFFPHCRDLFCGITASKTLQSKHLQPLRYGWPLSTWRRCWRFKWRNIARGGKFCPLFSLDEIHYFLFFFLFRSSAEMRRLQLLTRRTMRSWRRLDLLPRLGLSPISSLTIWKTTWLEGDTTYGGEYIF